jgi:hypothetical protein
VLDRIVEYSSEQTLVQEKSTLVILSVSDAGVVDRIDSVRDYKWSPDSEHIVYVTGTFRGRNENLGNTRAWIWDAGDKRRRQISDGGYFVSWASFDAHVYVWEFDKALGAPRSVVKYDPRSGLSEVTTHKSIYFSATGAYYYHPGGGLGLREEVYNRVNDVGMAASSQVLSQLSGWRPLGWAPDADLPLLGVRRKAVAGDEERAVIVFDPEADVSTDVATGTLPDDVQWGATSSEVLARTAERVERMAVTLNRR